MNGTVKVTVEGKEYSATYCSSKGMVYVNYGIADQKSAFVLSSEKGTAEQLLRELVREKYLP